MAEIKQRHATFKLHLSSSVSGVALTEGARRGGPCRERVRTVRSTPKAGEDVLSPTTEGTVLGHAELPTDSENTEVRDVDGEGRC